MTTALVARMDSLGDVLMAGPAVRAVAAAHERVVMLAGPRGSEAARLLPGVDLVLEWQAPWVDFGSPALTGQHVRHLVKTIRGYAPDRAFIFTSFHQSPLPLALLCRMAGVEWIGGISEDYPGTLLDLRHRVPQGIPEPLRALSLIEAAGGALPPSDGGELRILPVKPVPLELKEIIGKQPFIVFHPGSAVPARRPSPARARQMVAALSRAGHRVVVTGGATETELTAQVAGDCALDLGGRTGLAELAAVLADSEVVVAPNSGPGHLAAAVGTPVVSLFAPVVPVSAWSPFAGRVTVLGNHDAPCRATRSRKCPVPGHPCLDGITDTTLLGAVHQWTGEP